ncbi:hypothetical protein MMC30_003778 [Trapelia coarctata]|nr:hypothetical protein [Trapelia coarctata]
MAPVIVVLKMGDGAAQPGDRDTDIADVQNLSKWPTAWKLAFAYNLFPEGQTTTATAKEVSAGMDANFKSPDQEGTIFSEPFLEAMITHAKKETWKLDDRANMKVHQDLLAETNKKPNDGVAMSAHSLSERWKVNRHESEFDKHMKSFKYTT